MQIIGWMHMRFLSFLYIFCSIFYCKVQNEEMKVIGLCKEDIYCFQIAEYFKLQES